MHDGAEPKGAEPAAERSLGGKTLAQSVGVPQKHNVEVLVDYISADAPVHHRFGLDTTIGAVKSWARQEFVPNPPSDKAFYLNDDKTRHRFTEAEEAMSLAQLGYSHEAKFRLNEEQIAGAA